MGLMTPCEYRKGHRRHCVCFEPNTKRECFSLVFDEFCYELAIQKAHRAGEEEGNNDLRKLRES